MATTTTTTYTGQLSNVDSSGNLSILNPATAGSVVSLTTSGMNSSLSSYNNVQKLANALQPISVTAPASMDLGSYLTGNPDSNVNTIANLASTVKTINSNGILSYQVANNLTTSSNGNYVLDAYQGNVLNSNKADKTGTSYNAGSCPDNTTLGTNGSIARVYNSYQSAREDTRSQHDAGKVIAAYNSNFFDSGHMDVLAFGHIAILAIQGRSTKSSSDWICKLTSAYTPYTIMYFSYYLGIYTSSLNYNPYQPTEYRGHINGMDHETSGYVYFDTLDTLGILSAQIIITGI